MDLDLFSQSIWQERHSKNFSFFCPLCTSPRKTGMHPKPHQPILVFRVFVTSLFVTLALWNWLEWKGIVSFFPLWVGFEWIYRSKVRLQLQCPHCGFDPFLYLSRPAEAKDQVKEHFRMRFEAKGIPYPPERSEQHAAKKTKVSRPGSTLDRPHL